MTPYQKFCFFKSAGAKPPKTLGKTKHISKNNSSLVVQEKTKKKTKHLLLKALPSYHKTHHRFASKSEFIKEHLQSHSFFYYFKKIYYPKKNYKNYFFCVFSLNSELQKRKKKSRELRPLKKKALLFFKDTIKGFKGFKGFKDFKDFKAYNITNFSLLEEKFFGSAYLKKQLRCFFKHSTINVKLYKTLKNKKFNTLLFVLKKGAKPPKKSLIFFVDSTKNTYYKVKAGFSFCIQKENMLLDKKFYNKTLCLNTMSITFVNKLRFYLLTLLSKTKKTNITNKWLNSIHYYLIKKLIKKNVKIPCSILVNYLNMHIRFIRFFQLLPIKEIFSNLSIAGALPPKKLYIRSCFFKLEKSKRIRSLFFNELTLLNFLSTIKDNVLDLLFKSKCSLNTKIYLCFVILKKNGVASHKNKTFYASSLFLVALLLKRVEKNNLYFKEKSSHINLNINQSAGATPPKKVKSQHKNDLTYVKTLMFFYFSMFYLVSSTRGISSNSDFKNEAKTKKLFDWTLCVQHTVLLSFLLTEKQNLNISQKQKSITDGLDLVKTLLVDYHLLLARKQSSQILLLWQIQQKPKITGLTPKNKKQKSKNFDKKDFFSEFNLNLQQKFILHNPLKSILWQWNKKNQNKNPLYCIFKKYWLKIDSFYFFIAGAKLPKSRFQLITKVKKIKKNNGKKKLRPLKKIFIYLPLKEKKSSIFFFRNQLKTKNVLAGSLPQKKTAYYKKFFRGLCPREHSHYKFFSIVTNNYDTRTTFLRSCTRGIAGTLKQYYPQKANFFYKKEKEYTGIVKRHRSGQRSHLNRSNIMDTFCLEMQSGCLNKSDRFITKNLKGLLQKITIKKVYIETNLLRELAP